MLLAAALRLQKIPVIGLVPESSGTAPASPVDGQLWTDTSVTPKLVKIWDGAVWTPANIVAGTGAANYAAGNDSRITGAEQAANKNAANGYAGLTASKLAFSQLPTAADGATTASTVVIAADSRLSNTRIPTDASVTGGTAGAGVKIAALTITDANIATANKDGAAGTASLRTLGTGALQATAGNDARLSDQRVPTDGSVTTAKIPALTITDSHIAAANKDGAAGTASLRTLGLGAAQALGGTTRLDQIAVPTTSVNLNSQKITGLGAPTLSSDAARLLDVQNAQAGIDSKPSVRVRTTANVTIASPGATLDGVTMATNDRVLLNGQTTTTENDIWIWNGAATPMTRSTDTIDANAFVFAEEGTSADTSWVLTNNGAIVRGTTVQVWTQFAGAGAITGTANRITVSTNVVDISAAYIGQATITTLGTITTGTWQGTDIAVADGGTGANTAAAARTNLGIAQKGYAATLGAVTGGTPLVVTHSLGTQDVIAQVRDATTNEYIYADIINASTTTVSVTTGISYSASALKIVVLPVI